MASSSFRANVPTQFALLGNDPNPFNPETSIRFEVPGLPRRGFRSMTRHVKLVQKLVDAMLPAGRHGVMWRGRNESGEAVASGIYFITMEVPGTQTTRKGTLLK